MNATLVICLVNRPHDNSFQERGSCFKGRRRYWNIVRTLNCSLSNDDHTLLTLMLLEMARETTKRKMETKNRNSLPIPCVVPFFLFSTTHARFPFPDPRSPFLVICEIILLLNTEAEPWEYKNYPGNIIVAGMARRKSLQTPLNVKGSRITHILGTAEPLTHKRYKNGPWIKDPARVLMAIFWGQRERSSTSPPNGRANTPLIFVRKSVPGVN